jgi:hypothetical protein
MELLRLKADAFCRVVAKIGQTVAYLEMSPEIGITSEHWKSLADDLGEIENELKNLQLRLSLNQLALIRGMAIRPSSRSEVREGLAQLAQRIGEELELSTFLSVPISKVAYYEQKEPLFGNEVANKFPSTFFDITEAGKCYALGRSTACVFHLMRVLELGLVALGKIFSISLSHTNWGPAIDQIEKAIRNMGSDPDKPPDWKDLQEFYSQAASFLGITKDAWRNYTAHARGKYTEEEAGQIMGNVKAFMQRLATRLSE